MSEDDSAGRSLGVAARFGGQLAIDLITACADGRAYVGSEVPSPDEAVYGLLIAALVVSKSQGAKLSPLEHLQEVLNVLRDQFGISVGVEVVAKEVTELFGKQPTGEA